MITGGHHTSALVVAEELRKHGYEVIWFGHKFTMWGDRSPGAEYQEVTEAGFKFIEIKAGKFHRTYHPLKLARLPLGFVQSFYYLSKLRPDLILSFGGYLAVPVVICGRLLGIRSMTHEQTVVYGLGNRVIGKLANKIFVSWKTSLKHFPSQKVLFTGLPLRPEIFTQKKGKFDFRNSLPTIYITGGKQGAYVINRAIEKVLPEALKNYNLIHQVGRSTVYDDLASLQKAKRELIPKLKKRYLLQDYFSRAEVGHVFAASDLVVGRSGAHVTYEVAALGKPAIFIPLPFSFQAEQRKNAQLLVETKIARILLQSQLSGESLLQKINEAVKNLDEYKKAAPRAQALVEKNATQKIVDQINDFLEKKKEN